MSSISESNHGRQKQETKQQEVMLYMLWQYFQRTQRKKLCPQKDVQSLEWNTVEHPTVLHGLKIQKYKKGEKDRDTNTKENKPGEVCINWMHQEMCIK